MPHRAALLALPAAVLVLTAPAAPSAGTGTVATLPARFSATSVPVSAPVTVSVTAPRAVWTGGARVVLQRRVPGGRWTRETTSVPAADGSFSATVPTWWLGTRAYRVRLVGPGGRTRAVSPATTVRVRPRYAPPGRPRAHRLWTSYGSVSRWDPCRPIRYRVNPLHAPARASDEVRRAVARVAQATGLTFTYLGRTSVVPNARHDYGDADLLVAWRRPGEYPFHGALGVAPGRSVPGYRAADGSAVNRIVDGAVVLDAPLVAALPAGFGAGSRGQLLLHELGHVVGLEHVAERSQVMYPTLLPAARGRYGAGDLAGLERVGAEQGCLHRAGR